jgi:hypothetical protein
VCFCNKVLACVSDVKKKNVYSTVNRSHTFVYINLFYHKQGIII